MGRGNCEGEDDGQNGAGWEATGGHTAVNWVARRISATLDLRETLDGIVEAAAELVPCVRGAHLQPRHIPPVVQRRHAVALDQVEGRQCGLFDLLPGGRVEVGDLDEDWGSPTW